MNRRGFLKALPLVPFVPLAGASAAGPQPIQGVGVLRHPAKDCRTAAGDLVHARDLARQLAESVRAGSVIVLPNARDCCGDYQWDFRIENGDPAQVRVERNTAS